MQLPATAVNNAIFGYTNTEEVKGKFSQLYDAQLLVDGIKIFDGKFKLSEITRDYYKGNLGVPAPKTAKDIFGETMMNQAGTWLVDFKGIEDIALYNTGKHSEIEKYEGISPCIFPFVLYGLLPKRSQNGIYSDKNRIDNTVLFDINDYPPSVNCIHMLKEVFKGAGYELTGSALADERLKQLYVSYKNPNDYEKVQAVCEMKIAGTWGNLMNGVSEKKRYYKTVSWLDSYSVDLFNSQNIKIKEVVDSGYNIKQTQVGNSNNIKFTIPQSGLYKLIFKAQYRAKEGNEYIDINFEEGDLEQDFIELKVLRNCDEDTFKNLFFDNSFYKNNINQNKEGQNNKYPKAHQVNFIDPKQNPHFICGLAWGGEYYSTQREENLYNNPMVKDYMLHNPMAITGGNSWTIEELPPNEQDRYKAYSAVASEGYVYSDGKDANMFKIRIDGIPEKIKTQTIRKDNSNATGQVAQIVWLEKDETITIASTSRIRILGWGHHEIDFELSLEPFIPYKGWLKVDENNSTLTSGEAMNWNAPTEFELGRMNLIKQLPSNIKVNDWVENFCKAFNLDLVHGKKNTIELNVKNKNIINNITNIIDLDKRGGISQRTNNPLKLPYSYELGFTVDTNEEGYYRKMEIDEKTGGRIPNSGENGGGIYLTDSIETNKISQTSNFSYCWYMDIIDDINNTSLSIPVITDHDLWDNKSDYADMLSKEYYDKAQRFWYQSGIYDIQSKENNFKLAMVSNTYNDKGKRIILDYKDTPNSIIQNYFLLLTHSDNNYTIVDCLLTPEEYINLNKSFIKLNGDLYTVAEIDGYDPTCKRKASLKLIRKTI
ncbi:hypothetical protein [Dysgonomonas sp. 511]|uniref:hypothetical protein n=1 Tax=Dysgonomonas sp. 511 TaxID=2302930 RepID=UPI00210599F8|nr:hypothetical protein [Dysgonomonas sp. 511]